jgi:hypothetical protein
MGELLRNKNYNIYRDQKTLEKLAEEYIYIGRHVRLEPGRLTVLALAPPKEEKKKKIVDKRRERRKD